MNNPENVLSNYNSLLDKNLSGYFANTRMRKHLTKSGLIDREGRITSENAYRMKMAKKEHRDNVRDLLASAIVDKALDMERMRRYEIRKRLEELYKIELVQKVRGERGKRVNDDLVALLTPRKKSAKPRKAKSAAITKSEKRDTKLPSIHYTENRKKAFYDDAESSAGNSIGSLGMQPPKQTPLDSRKSKQQPPLHPHPPPGGKSKKKKRNVHRGLMLAKSDQMIAHRVQLQSMAEVTMKYLGSPLNLTNDMFPTSKLSEIQIIQQHSGASTICVFRELLPANTLFTFVSRRHRGSPFGLTIYINGIQNIRISSCCEYKHKPGHKVGGKNSQFGLVAVQGAAPCYRCQIRLNLVDGNKTTSEKEDPASSSDEEAAVKSYDIIVSRAGRHSESKLERPVSETAEAANENQTEEAKDYQDDEFDDDEEEQEDRITSEEEADKALSSVSSSSSSSESESEDEDAKEKKPSENEAAKNSDSVAEESSEKEDEEPTENKAEIKEESGVSSDSSSSSSSSSESEDEKEAEVPSEQEKVSDVEVSNSDAEKPKESENEVGEKEEEKDVSDDDDESTLSASSKSSQSDHEKEKEKEEEEKKKKSGDESDNESVVSVKSDDEKSETDAVLSDKVSDVSDKDKDSDTEVADTSDEESDNELPHDDEENAKKKDEELVEDKEKDSDDSPPAATNEDEKDEKLSIKIENDDEDEKKKADSDHSDSDSESDSDESDGGRATSVISRESTMLTGNEDGNFDAENKTIQFNEEVDVVTYAKIEGNSTEDEATPRSDDDGEFGSGTGVNVVLTDLGDEEEKEKGDTSSADSSDDDVELDKYKS